MPARTRPARPGFITPQSNFPGSSGEFAGAPSGGPGNGGYPVMDLAGRYPGDPLGRGGMPRTPFSRTSPSSTADLYQPLEIPKSPALAAASKDLFTSFGKASKALDFNALLDEARQAQGGVKSAFNNEQAAYDINDFSRNQRAADAAAAGASGAFASNVGDLVGEYRGNEDRYAGQLGDITRRAYENLGDYNKAARDIGDEQLGQLRSNVDRYKIGSGMGDFGVGSDELRKIAKGVANVELPLTRDRIQREYDVLTGIERPAAQEVASRAANRIAQFETPLERETYQNAYRDIMNSKQTDTMLKQLQIQTSQMSRQAAVEYLRSLSLPWQVIQQVLGGQTATAGGIGGLENEAYYRGLEYTPGADLSQPVAYNLGLPNYPGPRSSPFAGGPVGPATRTATTPGPVTVAGGGAPQLSEVNQIRAREAARQAYINQTGVDPSTDPHFNPDVFNNAVSYYSRV